MIEIIFSLKDQIVLCVSLLKLPENFFQNEPIYRFIKIAYPAINYCTRIFATRVEKFIYPRVKMRKFYFLPPIRYFYATIKMVTRITMIEELPFIKGHTLSLSLSLFKTTENILIFSVYAST